MSFLIDIDPNAKLPSYKLKLHKLNEESLASLKNIYGVKYSPLFVGVENLSFNVPFNISDGDGTIRKNTIYDLIEGNHLVKMNNMKYFIITNVREVADDNGNKYKEVQCKSREYELIDKKLIDYIADSRVLYDPLDTMLDGLEKGVLNYIFKYLTKAWSIGYVDPDLILREGKGIYRSLNFSNSNLIQVFVELQKTFNCIFMFDTIAQKVDVYDIKNKMGQDRGLCISDTNFIKNITKDVKSDGIVTRLYVRGKDGVSIQSISPTGQPYIDNFDFFKNTKYMTQGLIDALNAYQSKIESYNPDFKPLFIQLDGANTIMENLLNKDGTNLADKGLVALKTKLSQVQTLIDVKVEEIAIIQNSINHAKGTELSGLFASRNAAQSALDGFIAERTSINLVIKTREMEINSQQNIIYGIETKIKAMQHVLDTTNPANFTEAQLIELDRFVKVETFSDSNFTEHNIQELQEEGVRVLSRVSQPPIQFSTDVVDLFSIVECQHIWNKIVLGDVVTLRHKEMGFRFVVRLIGYDHDVDSHSLNLKFSNTNSYDDATLYERDLLEHISDTGITVDFNKDRWNDVGQIESRIAKMVDAKLEESRQNILNAVGQKYLFDDSGLWLYKENPNGTIDPSQIRGINSDIALTDDNWATVKTAISAKNGINAELIRGKLGQFARVEADQIDVGSNFGSTDLGLYINKGKNYLKNPSITGTVEGWNTPTSVTNQVFEGVSTPVLTSISDTNHQVGSDFFEVDPAKAYQVSVWVKRNNTGGSSYLGVWASSTSANVNNLPVVPVTAAGIKGVPSTNFYFWNVANNAALSDWYQVTGYILPSGFDAIKAKGIGTAMNMIMQPNTKKIAIRWLNYYNESVVRTMWVANPQVIEVDPNVLVGLANTNNNLSNLDANAIKQNTFYNRTKITSQEGIEIFDASGSRVLQMGGIATGSNNTKNAYGFKAEHTDGSFSALTKDGFMKGYPSGKSAYLADIWVGEFSSLGAESYDKLVPVYIELPERFKGRENNVEIFLSPVKFIQRFPRSEVTQETEVVLEIDWINFNRDKPYMDVLAYIRHYSAYVSYYIGMSFHVMIIGW